MKYFILHHLGLGDHIICNGLVRELIKDCDLLLFPVKHHNLMTIKRMFLDIDRKIEYISVFDDNEMLLAYQKHHSEVDKVIRLGNFFENNFIRANESFCESFYRQAEIDYKMRWDSFHYETNHEKEKYVLETCPDRDFIFVHDDRNRGFSIEDGLLTKDLYIYRPSHTLAQQTNTTIFDYVPLLEKSKEIHCMDSSFAAMIDHIPSLRNKTKYIHRYVRNTISPIYEKNWKVIK